jgi:hypothetical protein
VISFRDDGLNATEDGLNATDDGLNATDDGLNATDDGLNATQRNATVLTALYIFSMFISIDININSDLFTYCFKK